MLQKGCKGDFLFESTCAQAGVVLLVSTLEAYFKKRFKELEKEGWNPNLEKLYRKLFKRKHLENRIKEIEEKAKTQGKTIIEVLTERTINFQNLDELSRAYKSCYGIKLSNIFKEKPHLIKETRKIINYRHKIIHSGRDTTILNLEKLPAEPPEFANSQLLNKAIKIITEFVHSFHAATLQTKQITKQ